MEYITKKKIAQATKALLITQDFADVTVTAIMHEAKLRRQTFYDNFYDKYEVLAWIYNDEMQAVVKDNLNYEHWSMILQHTLRYFDANRVFYAKVFAIQDQNAPETVITTHVASLVRIVYLELTAKSHIYQPSGQRQFSQQLIAFAIVAEVKRWVFDPAPSSVAEEFEYLRTFLGDSIQGLIHHQAGGTEQ